MRKCVECAAEYNPNESYFPDTCDNCAAEIEGCTLEELHGEIQTEVEETK